MTHKPISRHLRAEGMELFTTAEIDDLPTCYCFDPVRIRFLKDQNEGFLPNCYALFSWSIRRK